MMLFQTMFPILCGILFSNESSLIALEKVVQSIQPQCFEYTPTAIAENNDSLLHYPSNNEWMERTYRTVEVVDLNNDGKSEKVMIAGNIIWDPDLNDYILADDGGNWAVVVESPEKIKTLVYYNWSQFGFINAYSESKNKQTKLIVIDGSQLEGPIESLYFEDPRKVIEENPDKYSMQEVSYYEPQHYQRCRLTFYVHDTSGYPKHIRIR